VMFVLQNAPAPAAQLPGLTLETLPVGSGTAKFDLTLAMEEHGAELVASFEYATDLFDAATIARMAAHFGQLLESIACDPEQRIADLPLLDEAERRRLVREWNDTAEPYPQKVCLHELLAAQAARTPEATAVEYEDERLSYRELDERANQL